MVFDGARAFEGVTPDLDLHCARVNQSAARFYLKPLIPTRDWIALAREGLRRSSASAAVASRVRSFAMKAGTSA
jgi:branched-chain amino acid aminotransferase